MRKFFSFFAAAALLMFCLTSCQKDQTKITIKARIASNGLKTELGPLNGVNQHPIHWNSGDQIMVWGNGGQQKVFTTTGSGASVVFEAEDCPDNFATTNYTAGYPSDKWQDWVGHKIVEIPTVQKYVNGNIEGFPMFAEMNGDVLEFHNVCGIVKLNLPAVSGALLSKLIVMAHQQISGEFVYTTNNRHLEPSLGSDMVEINFATPLDLTSSQSVMVYIPASSYPDFTIELYADVNSTHQVGTLPVRLTSTESISVEQSRITTLNISGASGNISWSPLGAYFSVSDNLQVDFAHGNLMYGNGQFYIAGNDYVFYGKGVKANGSDDVIDLFDISFGENNNYGVLKPYPVENNSDWEFYQTDEYGQRITENGQYVRCESYRAGSNFVDWSSLVNNEATASQPWRLLSYDEWHYLMFQRKNAADLRTFVTVTGVTYPSYYGAAGSAVTGLLIFPDDWMLRTNRPNVSLSFDSYFDYDNENNVRPEDERSNYFLFFKNNAISKTQCDALITAGAVFIPAVGTYNLWDRLVHDGNADLGAEGILAGVYWTSSFIEDYSEWLMVSNFIPNVVPGNHPFNGDCGHFYSGAMSISDPMDAQPIRFAKSKLKKNASGAWENYVEPSSSAKSRRK